MKKNRIYITLVLCLVLVFSNSFSCVASSSFGYNVGLKERYQLYDNPYEQFECKAIYPVDDNNTADLIYNQMAKLYSDEEMGYDYVFFWISTSGYNGDFTMSCYGINTTGSLDVLCYTYAITSDSSKGNIIANEFKDSDTVHYLDETRVDEGIYRNGMNGFYIIHSDELVANHYECTVHLDGTLEEWEFVKTFTEEDDSETLNSYAVIPSDTNNVIRGLVYTNANVYGNINLNNLQGLEGYQSGTNSNVCASPSLSKFIEYKDRMTNYNKGACWNGETVTVDNMELSENEFMGFKDFAVRRTIDYSIFGNYGAILTYTLPANYEDFITPTSKLVLEVTWTYGVSSAYSYMFDEDMLLNPNSSFLNTNTIYDTVTVELSQNISSSSGQIAFDFAGMCLQDISIYGPIDLASLCCALSYERDNSYTFGDFLSDNVVSYVAEEHQVDLSGIFKSERDDMYFGITSMECNIEGYITNGTEKSKVSYGYVDLIDGINQSIANQPNSYDESNNVVVGGANGNSNLTDVERDTNANGETVYTEVKVDGSSSNAEVINNVTFPDIITVNVNGVSNGGSGGNFDSNDIPDITIEDDDYTDTALREDLKDGFGLLDDISTEKDNDGFLAMLGLAYSTINPNLVDILGFGISTVVVVNILRAILKR
ncbi:MAG: hypothetical protein E7258_05300 [Lachnospiraceae bacterium]|nr:hypothetical protein [Lachnospiraceae bacterium]